MAASGGGGQPGTLLDEELTVACGDGALRLIKVQRAGKSVMSAAELLKGFALARGTQLA
jgi:methionyl-tRNA formyltransferase